MIIGLLICSIGIIPIVLAWRLKSLYKGFKLSTVLYLDFLFITIWQLDIGILYFKDLFSKNEILLLFRLFRVGPTYSIPVTFYITCMIMSEFSSMLKSDTKLYKFLKVIFTKKTLFILIIWSSFIYFLNWTTLGIEGLKIKHIKQSSIEFYFPEYGSYSWLFSLHIGSSFILLLFILILSRKMLSTTVKRFFSLFSIYSFFLFLTGFLNFSPETGGIAGSIGVIIFSVMIMMEFIKLNTNMTINYNRLIERQKKLDYTGNLAGSLIHEVKNSNQIIKGFAQILRNSQSLTQKERDYLEMILKGSDQLEDLTNYYREYMKSSKIEFEIEDLIQIINSSIEFLQEMLNEKKVEIKVKNHYPSLTVCVNKTSLFQVFVNLIKNSLEAMPANRENRKISIHTDLIMDHIIIDYYDNGKGIPPEKWDLVFDPFTSFKNQGMGMGLPFVKKIIFEHRGDIQIMSSTPVGTHFQIKIPQFEVN